LSVGSTENTASFIVACLTVFTELFPGIALIKSVNKRKELTTNLIKNVVLLVVMSSYSEKAGRFGEVYRVYIQGRRVSQARNQQKQAVLKPEPRRLHVSQSWP
jgi:hypothetical protein